MQAKPSRKKNNSSKIIVDQYEHMLAHSKMYHPKNESFVQTPLQYTMDPKKTQIFDQSSQSQYSLQQNFKQQQQVCRNCGQSFPSRIYISHLNVCQLELKRFSSLNFSKKQNKQSNSTLHYEDKIRHNDYEVCGSNVRKQSIGKNSQINKNKEKKDIQFEKQTKNLKKTYSKKQDLYDQDVFGSSKYLKRPNSSNKNKVILTKGYENMKEKILTKLQSKQKNKCKNQKLQTFNSIYKKSPSKIKSSLSKQKDQRQSVSNSRYKKITSNRDQNLRKVKNQNQKLNLNNQYMQFNRSDIYGSSSKQKNQRVFKIPSTQEAISKLRLKDIKQLKEANHKNQLKKKNITLHQMNNSIRNIPERQQQKAQLKNQRKGQKKEKQKQVKNNNYNQKLQSHYRLGKNKQQSKKNYEKVFLGQRQRQKQYKQEERPKNKFQYEQRTNKDQVQRQYYPNAKKGNILYKKQEQQKKQKETEKVKKSQKKQQNYLQQSENYLQNQPLNRNNIQSGNRRRIRSPSSSRNANLGNRQNQRIRTQNRNRQNTNNNHINQQQRSNRNHVRRQSNRQQQNTHSRQNVEEGQRPRQRRQQQNSNRRRTNQSSQNNPVRNNTFNFISQTLTDQFQMMNEHFNLMNNIFSNFNNFVNVNINTNQPTSFVFRSGPNNIRVRRRNREYQNNSSSQDSQDSDSSYTSTFIDSQEGDESFYYQNQQQGQNGMTQHQISSIPILKYSKHHHGHNQCTICLVQFTESQIFKKLFCDHMFHVDCIDQWLRRKSDCPVCRDKMGSD